MHVTERGGGEGGLRVGRERASTEIFMLEIPANGINLAAKVHG